MRFMTLNLRYDNPGDGPNRWSARRGRVLSLLEELRPEVVGFQEALPHQRQFLQKNLAGYLSLGRGRDHDGGGEQCCLFLRQEIDFDEWGTFWLSPEPELPGSRGWDAQLPRICTWARLGNLTVYNAHFDHAGARAREESARLLLRRLSGHCVVMGDFNDGPESPALQLLRRELVDAGPDEGTFHGFGALPTAHRIDYILATHGLQVGGAEVLRRPVSDHYPVIAEIS